MSLNGETMIYPCCQGSKQGLVLISPTRYTQSITSSQCHYGKIDPNEWLQPDWSAAFCIPAAAHMRAIESLG